MIPLIRDSGSLRACAQVQQVSALLLRGGVQLLCLHLLQHSLRLLPVLCAEVLAPQGVLRPVAKRRTETDN
jgi:hypothetical protein